MLTARSDDIEIRPIPKSHQMRGIEIDKSLSASYDLTQSLSKKSPSESSQESIIIERKKERKKERLEPFQV